MTEKEVLEKLNFFKESIFSLKKEIAENEELIVGLTNANKGFQEEIKKLNEEVEYWKEKAMENPEEINEVENYKESSQKMFDENLRSQFVGTSLLYIKDLVKKKGAVLITKEFVDSMKEFWSLMTPKGIRGFYY